MTDKGTALSVGKKYILIVNIYLCWEFNKIKYKKYQSRRTNLHKDNADRLSTDGSTHSRNRWACAGPRNGNFAVSLKRNRKCALFGVISWSQNKCNYHSIILNSISGLFICINLTRFIVPTYINIKIYKRLKN